MIFFSNKLKKTMEWLENKNKKSGQNFKEEDFKLDKTDILALIISALLVFGPLIFFLFLIAFLISL